VCDIETSTMRCPRPELGSCTPGKKVFMYTYVTRMLLICLIFLNIVNKKMQKHACYHCHVFWSVYKNLKTTEQVFIKFDFGKF
jgi:hypothetical protein